MVSRSTIQLAVLSTLTLVGSLQSGWAGTLNRQSIIANLSRGGSTSSSIRRGSTSSTRPGATSQPSSASSSQEQIVYVKNTIVLRNAGTYDYKGKIHVWRGRNWNCTAERENGPQILRIEGDNITVKNFKFVGDGRSMGSNGLGDPIHVTTCGSGQGNSCPRQGPRNVTLDGIQGHACEDLITIGSPGARNITVQNSILRATPSRNAWDKTIQINFGTNIRILNNRFEGGARCVRFKPRTSGIVQGNTFNNCITAIQASSNDADIRPMRNGPTTVTVRNNRYNNVKNRVRKLGSQVTIRE